LNVSRSEAPLAFKTWIIVLASENISLSQFVARQRFGRTARERGCAASAACPVGLTSIFNGRLQHLLFVVVTFLCILA